MALLPYVTADDAPPEVREALSTAPDWNVIRMVAQAPTALNPWMALGGTLLSDLELDPLLRELAILEAARTCGCEYVHAHHRAIAEELGASAEQLLALDGAERSEAALAEAFSPLQRAVLDFTEETVRTGRGATARVAALRDRLGDRQIVELLLVTGYYAGLGLLLNTLDVVPDDLGRDSLDTALLAPRTEGEG